MSEWISVEDMLPEYNRKVLVLLETGEIWIDEYIDRGYAEYFAVWHGLVTHWMPLPEPPKQ